MNLNGGGDIGELVGAMPLLATTLIAPVQGAGTNAPHHTGGALEFYGGLIHQKMQVNISSKGQPNPAPAPESFAKSGFSKCFEDVYDQPVGKAVVPRLFYPYGDRKEEDFLKLAHNWCPSNASSNDINNCVEFMKQTKKLIGDKINSKLRMHFQTKLRDAGVTYQGRQVTSLNNAVKAFKEELSRTLCEKLHEIFYGSLEVGNMKAAIEYEIMHEMNLWHSNDKTNDLNYDPNSKKNKASSVISHIGKQCRSNFRKRYQEASKFEHGVTLTISVKGGRKEGRRDKGQFDFETCVVGWDGDKHKAWLAKKDAKVTTMGCFVMPWLALLKVLPLFCLVHCYLEGWCDC